MPNIGPLEIAIVLIIALVIFGPSRLPDLGRSAGKGLREFKESITGNGDDDEREDDADAKAIKATANGTGESRVINHG